MSRLICATIAWLCHSTGFALLFIATDCNAVLTDNLTIGNAKAIGLGHAVTADPPGIDAIHFNPAGLAELRGRQSQYKLISGDFSVVLEFGDYMEERQDLIDEKQADGNFPDGFFTDSAKNTTSETEGATLMLPFVGMTDIPVLLGVVGGASYSPPGSNFTFATGVYTPLAVGFNRADDDPGRFIGSRLSLFRLTYFAPTLAYRLSETLSLGAGINFSYSGVGLDLNFRGPHVGLISLAEIQQQWCDQQQAPPIDVCGGQLPLYGELGELSVAVEDPLSLGINVGALWQPMPWLSVGAVYQSESDMNMEGEFTWNSSDSWVNFLEPIIADDLYQGASDFIGLLGWSLPQGKPNLHGKASLDMTMPEHFALGISLQITPSFKVNMDYKFTAWSAWPALPIEFSVPIDVLRLAEIVQPDVAARDKVVFPFGLEDSWNYAIGLEYQVNDQLSLRAGYEPRASSVPADSITPLLPVGDGTFYGVGMGYQLLRGGSWDIGLGYFASEVDMKDGASRLGNSTDPTLLIYNPYPGTDITAKLSVILLEISYQKRF